MNSNSKALQLSSTSQPLCTVQPTGCSQTPLPSTSLPASFPPQTTRRHKHAKNSQPQSSTQPARGRTTQGGLCGCNEHKSGRSLTPDQAWGAHHARSSACHGRDFFTLSFSRHLLKSCMKHVVGTKRTNTL